MYYLVSGKTGVNAGIVVGGTIGGIVVVFMFGALCFLVWKRIFKGENKNGLQVQGRIINLFFHLMIAPTITANNQSI